MRETLLFLTCLVLSAYSNPINENKGCTIESGCPNNLVCHMSECVDPCADGICGSGALCVINNNNAVCSCPKGFVGNPYIECRPEEDLLVCVKRIPPTVDYCVGPCGKNTTCTVVKQNSVIVLCTCLEGMTGDPLDFCAPIDD